jgi:hypothetical protein
LWATFFGLAAANAMRMSGHPLGLKPLAIVSVVLVTINLIAMIARCLESRAVFYFGVCCSLLSVSCVLPPFQLNPEHREHTYIAWVVRGSLNLAAGLGVGAAIGVGIGCWGRKRRPL